MKLTDLTGGQRAQALYYYFGWKGGTIHQLAAATGIKGFRLLDDDLGGNAPLCGGFSAVRTCEAAWRRDMLAPKHQGDEPYWRDVIIGFWITGPLAG